MRGVESPAMSSPAKLTLPWLGFSIPVMRLNKVDLPAPFGPITARTSPSSTRIDTWSTATMPPKRRVSSSSSSNATAVFPLYCGSAAKAGADETPYALRGEDYEGDENEAEEQGPGLRVIAELMLDRQEERRTQHRADQGAGAADDDHDQNLPREQPEQQLGICEAGEWRVERPGKRAQRIRQCYDGDLVGAGVVAERQGLGLVLSDAAQHRAERRAHQRSAEQKRAGKDEQHEIVKAVAGDENAQAERARATRNARKPVGAAGNAGPFVGDGVEQLRKGKGQHREGDTGRLSADPGDPNRDDPGKQGRDRNRCQHRQRGMQQQPAAGIGAETIGRGMAE